MDRFIAIQIQFRISRISFKIQYGQIYRLCEFLPHRNLGHLKSNMDRFIVYPFQVSYSLVADLKSNMDRFIGKFCCRKGKQKRRFKIQYGQIYSPCSFSFNSLVSLFKIQYGQIYRQFDLIKIFHAQLFKIQYGQIYSYINPGAKR